jgi:hypothetical protein
VSGIHNVQEAPVVMAISIRLAATSTAAAGCHQPAEHLPDGCTSQLLGFKLAALCRGGSLLGITEKNNQLPRVGLGGTTQCLAAAATAAAAAVIPLEVL